MAAIPEELIIAAATAVVTALLSVATTYRKIRRDLEAEYDKDLRERRLKAYTALWALSEPLARFSPARPLSADGARALSERLRSWYFREGIVLSEAARQAYFAFQEALTAKSIAAAPARTEPLAAEVVRDLHALSRAMHAALSHDIGSRRPPMIADGPKR